MRSISKLISRIHKHKNNCRRIIDLGQIDYRPPPNSNCACSVRLFWGCVSRSWPGLDQLDRRPAIYGCAAQYWPRLPLNLPNKYVYRTNGMHRSRLKCTIYFSRAHRLQLSQNLRDSPGYLAAVPGTRRLYCNYIVGPGWGPDASINTSTYIARTTGVVVI